MGLGFGVEYLELKVGLGFGVGSKVGLGFGVFFCSFAKNPRLTPAGVTLGQLNAYIPLHFELRAPNFARWMSGRPHFLY